MAHEFSIPSGICQKCRLMAQDELEHRSFCPGDVGDLMDFDHVIRVNEDGTVSHNIQDVHAPSLLDDALDSPEWKLFDGHSGQYGYSGPIMHNSEFIGVGLGTVILSEPGYYVTLVSNYSTCPDCEGGSEQVISDCLFDHVEGWAIAHRELGA